MSCETGLIFPKTQGIKYAGSKLKIIPHIVGILADLNHIESVLDGFSGTTRTSQAFAQLGYETTSNDISVWSHVFATCYLKSKKPNAYYQEILDHLNSLNGFEGWYTLHYGGTIEETKKPFQIKNTRKLDAVREGIEKLSLDWIDKCVILTSLILGLDCVDSTLGHYVSYLKKWSKRSYNDLFLQLPRRFDHKNNHTIIKDDIFNTIKTRSFDLAYFDPPYGSNNEKMPPSRVRYNSYYHLWTTIILNDRPALFGKVNRREDSKDTANPSVFESFKKDDTGRFSAINALYSLIKETNARYIMLSYSSGGRATKQQLIECLEDNGTIKKVFEIDYRKNIMASMTSTNVWSNRESKNAEYLFLLEKKYIF